MSSKRFIGSKAEDLACEYLKNQGYKILERNFYIRGGEVDIIAKDNEVLAFVEVKARYSHNYGLPVESITSWKLKALIKTAKFYVAKNRWGDREYRIDFVAIDFSNSFKEPKIELLKNITL